mgnify:CR=1 FL=1
MQIKSYFHISHVSTTYAFLCPICHAPHYNNQDWTDIQQKANQPTDPET